MHQARNLTWKQERFVSEYLLSGNAAEAVRRAGYQTRYPSEVGYGLKILCLQCTLHQLHVLVGYKISLDL